MKNKVFVLINIIGLGISLACCIVAFLNWDFNSKFDEYHVDTENVYRVNFIRMINGRPIKNGSCPFPLGSQIKNSVGQVSDVIRYYPLNGDIKVGNDLFRTAVSGVDPEFFKTFTFPLVAGSISEISDITSIVISTELQEKFFPNKKNAVGESLTFINGDKLIEYRVIGVFEKPPLNNSFFEGAFFHYDNVGKILEMKEDNWALFNTTFVTVDNPADVPKVESQLKSYVEIQNRAKEDYKVSEYYLDPFNGMAVRSERQDIRNHWLLQSLPTAAAIAPGIMALLILLIACFNFTNTSIAIANRRIKEIGIRKVLGSNRKQLIFQFLGENTFIAFLALIAGLIIAAFLVPAYSALWPFLEINLNLFENIQLVGFLILLLLVTALIAGSYPALYVSSFRPTTILRGTVKFSGTNFLNRILLTLQYGISLIAIISGFVFTQNAIYQENYDMGFDQESILFANVNDEQGFTKMRNELLNYDMVKSISGSRHNVASSWYTDPIKYESTDLETSILDIGAGYLSTIGATILEGRGFRENSQADVDGSVIINQELARTMGWDNPIDKRIHLRDTIPLNVIGVVKDIYFEGALWDPLEPMLLRNAPQSDFRYLSVRADTEDLLEVKTLMDEKWRTVFPNELSKVRFMKEEQANSLLVNYNIRILFLFLGALAVILSAIGLFSLVSLNLIKRNKEIGIRKVLGATIGDIAIKVSKEFIIILMVSSVLGSVAAYYLTQMLMGSIWAYYTPVEPILFAISILVLLLISGVTMGGKIVKAALVNPADILGDE